MMNKLFYTGIVILLFTLGFYLANIDNDEIHLIKRSQILLGTIVEIQIKDADKEKAASSIGKAFAEIKRIDDLFSTYKEESPVWKINNSNDTIFTVDNEIYNLMVISDSLWKISNGAFDVSLNNLITAWEFDCDSPSLPGDNKILTALNKSSWQNINLTGSNSFKRKNNVELDFGAIAKGYAVDKAIFVLKENKIDNALINAGGDIKTIGDDWMVGIQHPRNRNQIMGKVNPGNMSVATSGDYEKYFMFNGKRYHHILNPETGYPADSLISVTVISRDCTTADALATAVFVLGPAAGKKLIEQLPNTEAMMIDNEMNKIYSSGFEKFISDNAMYQ